MQLSLFKKEYVQST